MNNEKQLPASMARLNEFEVQQYPQAVPCLRYILSVLRKRNLLLMLSEPPLFQPPMRDFLKRWLLASPDHLSVSHLRHQQRAIDWIMDAHVAQLYPSRRGNMCLNILMDRPAATKTMWPLVPV